MIESKTEVKPVEMTTEEYNKTILEIESIAKCIEVTKSDCDGRIDSAMTAQEDNLIYTLPSQKFVFATHLQ